MALGSIIRRNKIMEFCYGYPNFPSANKSIDDLNLPGECLKGLQRTGIEYIGDVLDIYARSRSGGATGALRISLKCYSIIFRKIISLEGCPWQDEIEDWLIRTDKD